ncbi:MAG: glycosyltransferase family 2 protein [Myxococcota bacterium]|nr:glycosyltransferase family 2 protein [Myxococcota bacterium]
MSKDVSSDRSVSLVVVNFNGEHSLRECVSSLLDSLGDEVELLLVDNDSSDQSPRILDEMESKGSSIQVVRLEENLGYAGAVNHVLPRCEGRYVGVLNMDIQAEENWLAPLVDFLDQRPEVAAVNPLLTLRDGQIVNAAGQDVHITGLGFNHALGAKRTSMGQEPFPVSGIQGAAFLVRKSVLEQMGGIDDSGFLYHEDVNLSWILRLMGHDLYCVPTAVVRHDYFLSMHAEKLYLLERNRLAMLSSYLHGSTRIWLSPLLLLTEFFLWGYALLRGPDFLRAKGRSYSWVGENRSRIHERRDQVRRLRTRSDFALLAAMKLAYPWRQFLTLARERAEPRNPLPAHKPAERD